MSSRMVDARPTMTKLFQNHPWAWDTVGFFPQLADAPEIGEMKSGQGATRLDPAIAELGAGRRDAQERHQIGLLTAPLESPVHVRHEDLVVGDEMIRRKE